MTRTITRTAILLSIVGTWIICTPLAFPQVCRTVGVGTSSAHCAQTGAACSIASGVSGSCQFLNADRVCDCEPKAGGSGGGSGPSGPTATVQNVLSNPVFVNLYWDSNWDADNPTLQRHDLDVFTDAMVRSSYFRGLSEYGVQSASFAQSFLPAPECASKAPSTVPFFLPFGTSIMGFFDCELNHGNLPTGSQVVYNIILPAGSIESDLLGAHQFCQGSGSPSAWHFHQDPYSVTAIIGGVLGGVLGGITGGGVGGGVGALAGLLLAMDETGGPIYTITSADSACQALTGNLMHEMVEAATDPFVPASVILNGGDGEIADLAQDANCFKLNPFAPPFFIPVVPARTAFPSLDQFTNNISVPQYWSNAKRACTAGSDTTGPAVRNVSTSGNGATLSLDISGSGFGTLPIGGTTLPYIAIQDRTQGWQAGNSLNNDEVGLNIASWTDSAITVNGFQFLFGNLVMLPHDQLDVWVCNPSSGNCDATTITLSESGEPELNVTVYNLPQVEMAFAVKIDGTQEGPALGDGGSTGWHLEPAGTHVITEVPTTAGHFTATFTNGCDSLGRPTLKTGDNLLCTIVNIPNDGCSASQHCCGPVNSKVGCSTGCVSTTVACESLCPFGTNKCCGKPGPNGKCDGACVNSPTQSRQ